MMLAHFFAMHGRSFGGGFLFFLMVLAIVVIVFTWPGKTEPK